MAKRVRVFYKGQTLVLTPVDAFELFLTGLNAMKHLSFVTQIDGILSPVGDIRVDVYAEDESRKEKE